MDMQTAVRDYLNQPGPHCLELGAGQNGKPGWLSTDLEDHPNHNGTYSIGLDVTKPFAIETASFDFIYCEHMIEHLAFSGGQHMLAECWRVLKSDGVLRIATPSMGFLLRIVSADRSRFEQEYFDWSLSHFVPDAPRKTNAFFLNNFMRAWGHQFIYDHETLHLALDRAKFRHIVECPIAESAHAPLSGLEHVARLRPGYLDLESMIFEATK